MNVLMPRITTRGDKRQFQNFEVQQLHVFLKLFTADKTSEYQRGNHNLINVTCHIIRNLQKSTCKS